jgi:hypothetical protein
MFPLVYYLTNFAMKTVSILTILAPAVLILELGVSAALDVEEFCSSRPVGMYCNPEDEKRKIECPSGKSFLCNAEPGEHCQERGILKTSGFKGGIARCVPKLDETKVEEFCSSRRTGMYCWPERSVLKIQCPTGLVYKCTAGSSPNATCVQRPTGARCVIRGQEQGSTVCPVLTVTATDTVTETVTNADTITVTDTVTTSVTSTVSSGIISTVTLSPVTVTETSFSTIVPTTSRTPVVSTVTVNPTSTEVILSTSVVRRTSSVGGAGGQVTVVFPPQVTTVTVPANTMTLSPPAVTVTSTTRPSGATNSTPTIVPPQPTSDGKPCPENGQVDLGNLPGVPFRYQYISTPLSFGDAWNRCRAINANSRLAYISTTNEHWRLGNLLCVPSWYQNWNGDQYQEACIALYPGGATAVPAGGCAEKLPSICQVPL